MKVETSAGKWGDGDAVINEYPYQTLRAWNTSHYMIREGRPIKENDEIIGWNWTSWKELVTPNLSTYINANNNNVVRLDDLTNINELSTPGLYVGEKGRLKIGQDAFKYLPDGTDVGDSVTIVVFKTNLAKERQY